MNDPDGKEDKKMSFRLREYRIPDFTEKRFEEAPDAVLLPAPKDGVVPDCYHAMSIFPEYFKLNGKWLLAEESRMDCVAVYDGTGIRVKEFRNVRKNELVVVGREEDASCGIYVHPDGFSEQTGDGEDLFAFRRNRSRETAFSKDYDELYDLLKHERDHGNIVWVMGPACSFDADAKAAFSRLADGGYVHALLAGNALATHDLEGAWLHTALGQNIYTQERQRLGHYNHLDTLNRIRACGSIKAFIEQEHIGNGIIAGCINNGIPVVLASSIRDDGPVPDIIANAYEAQDAMRNCVRKATTVICMASALHTIAVGNMTPSYRVLPDGTVRQVYFYTVDVSEFAVRKLSDRGSLSAKSIVTNAQDFIVNVSRGVNRS